MKTKSIISILLLALGLSFTTSSCEDMLTADSDRNLYRPAQDTLYSYWGILADMQRVAERYTILGEVRGDLISPTSFVSDTISAIANFDDPADGDNRHLAIKDYYKIINDCNSYMQWADTTFIIMGNVQKMKKEYAQVMAIRAWTYLQLVNNYGKVPFYTKAISSLDFFDNFTFDDTQNYVDRHNIADLLAPELIKLQDIDYPVYGSYHNGSQSISAALCNIPIRLVLADMYLIGEDYYNAAINYYEYIKKEEATLPSSFRAIVDYVSEEDRYILCTGASYLSVFSQTTAPSKTNEVITSIPCAASNIHGYVYTDIVSLLCGYDVESQVSSNNAGSSDETDNKNQASISMSVQTSPQCVVSGYYAALTSRSVYNEFNTTMNPNGPYYRRGDGRRTTVTRRIMGNDQIERMFMRKPLASGFSYTFPILYRKATVWLRFAEAINRLGFPQYAFAILKDGLCDEYIPAAPEKQYITTDDEEEGEETLNEEEGDETTDNDEDKPWEWVYNPQRYPCYYIGIDERLRALDQPYLDFSNPLFANNATGSSVSIIGVHRRGGGDIKKDENPFWDYSNILDSVMLAKGIDTAFVKEDQLKAADERVFTLNDTIALIEELIVDELALEMAFEGNRFTDLVRFANHRNADPALTSNEIYQTDNEKNPFVVSQQQKTINQNGTAWLADKVARRGCPQWAEFDGLGHLVPDNYESTGEYQRLFNKLLNPQLWYFSLPANYK